jgi:glucose-1-phosphate thymidylyltransferase
MATCIAAINIRWHTGSAHFHKLTKPHNIVTRFKTPGNHAGYCAVGKSRLGLSSAYMKEGSMNIILPTAGLGTRLRPHTFSKPKPLVPVAGKPMLGHVLDRLEVLPIDKMVFIVGYLGEQIEQYVNEEYQLPTEFIVQHELKGQAHAIQLAKGHVTGPTLILFVDTLVEADLKQLSTSDVDGVLYVQEVEDPRRFGVVEVRDGHVVRLIEKPDTTENRLAVVGLYYVRDVEQLFAAIDDLIERNIQTKGEFYLADALQLMIERGATFTAERVSVWEDCGTPSTVLQTNRFLLDQGYTKTINTQHSVLVPPVYVHEDVIIENSVIGPHVAVGKGSTIRNAVIRDSILGDGVNIHGAILEASIIGAGAEVSGSFRQLNVGDASSVDGL